MDSGDICALVDPDLEDQYELNQMRKLVLAASYCIQQSSERRPSMTEVHASIDMLFQVNNFQSILFVLVPTNVSNDYISLLVCCLGARSLTVWR